MTMATTIQKLSIAAASASVLAIAAHATPAEAARIFGFESSYEGFPITGSFTIDDTTPGTSPVLGFDISYYAKAISQATVTGYGQSLTFQDVDFYVGNDLLGSDTVDAIAFSLGPIQDALDSNFVAVLFPGFLSSFQVSSSSLSEALDALDGATGIAFAPYLAEDGEEPFYEVSFFEKKDTASVPEPASLVGLLGVGAFVAGSAWKRKQNPQQL
ncbi:PEP-CTERM sorting domain-containing protein [Trichocoleus desertorum GB2-A4]|uniref:PEP-CTERM sorting domain-containing protein n=2 Tax=Trichocoleusaceae TaxID=2303527 RepID=A0ABV0J7L1_9CYAN|nr:PEP-CTERM sorting domain-containing protein [Trichocoleus sp. FACHB-46]